MFDPSFELVLVILMKWVDSQQSGCSYPLRLNHSIFCVLSSLFLITHIKVLQLPNAYRSFKSFMIWTKRREKSEEEEEEGIGACLKKEERNQKPNFDHFSYFFLLIGLFVRQLGMSSHKLHSRMFVMHWVFCKAENSKLFSQPIILAHYIQLISKISKFLILKFMRLYVV